MTVHEKKTALVQTFGINATKRSGTLRGSCGENSIPDFWRPVVFDAKLSKFELTFPDPMHEFNAGDGDRGALKALQSEHWTQTKFDRPVILLDQIVQIFRRSYLSPFAAPVFAEDFPPSGSRGAARSAAIAIVSRLTRGNEFTGLCSGSRPSPPARML